MPRAASPLHNSTYRRVFAAQVVALAGTGLSTVALSLLAFDLTPSQTARTLGGVLALKMVVYVSVSLVAPLWLARGSRGLASKKVLIGLDVIRAALVLPLPYVNEIWQVYLLIAGISACSATFKPVFQAMVPDILPNEDEYTRALSLTRLAYDLENVLSPALAATLLMWMEPGWLFYGTSLGFVASACLLRGGALPGRQRHVSPQPLRATFRTFWRTPRLRALLALNLSAAAAGTSAIVTTVHYVRSELQLDETSLSIALLATGAGSMLVALSLPRLLHTIRERTLMVTGALLAGPFVALASRSPSYRTLLGLLFAIGAMGSMIQVPIGRVVVRSVPRELRSSAFAVQFSLSHACWLLTYGLAALLPTSPNSRLAYLTLGGTTFLAAGAALLLGRRDAEEVEHSHDLPPDHPHLEAGLGVRHTHTYVIDEHHTHWPGH